jgi:hypothetical protein
MRHIWENMPFNSPNNSNDYQNSSIHDWLNATFVPMIAQNVRDHIRQVRVPFRPGNTTSMTVNSGANGLQARAFLLAFREVGGGSSADVPADGAVLALYSGTLPQGNSEPRRVATLNGTATVWWLRTPHAIGGVSSWRVLSNGNMEYGTNATSRGIRPALVLPSSLLVSGDGSVITDLPPTMPANLNVPATILGGSNANISWSASADPNTPAQPISYRLDRSVNGGVWSSRFTGSALSFNDAVASGTTTVQYRVRAFNTSGLESANNTSTVRNVVNNRPPSIDGANGSLGVQSAAFTQNYVVTDPDVGDTLTVTETLNGTLIRQYNPTSGAPQTLTVILRGRGFLYRCERFPGTLLFP